MRVHGRQFSLAILAILFLIMVEPCFAQTTNASLEGIITDPSGAVIAGAKVTVKNVDTSLTQVVTSSEVGLYLFASLPPGSYNLTVEQTGFKKDVSAVTLNVGQKANLDFRLSVGSQVQAVDVVASQVLLDTKSAEISTVIEEKVVTQLPLNGRDPAALMFLSPGIVNILQTSAGYTQNTDSFSNETGAPRVVDNREVFLPCSTVYPTWIRILVSLHRFPTPTPRRSFAYSQITSWRSMDSRPEPSSALRPSPAETHFTVDFSSFCGTEI